MDDSVNARRRRGLGVVTPNACQNCRKKRAKCDGQVPCGRCASQPNVECVYEVPVRQSKENMRSEIEQLRASQQQSDRVLAALLSDETSNRVLEQLRGGVPIETITKALETPGAMATSSNSDYATFNRYSEHQAIESALRPARSIGSSPLSTITFSGSQRSSSFPIAQSQGAIPAWASGSESASDYHNAAGGTAEDVMSWEAEGSQERQQNSAQPLIGTVDYGSRPQTPTSSTVVKARGHGKHAILGLENQSSNQESQHSHWTSVTTNEALVDHFMALYFCWEYPTFASLSKEHFLDDFKSGTARYCSPLLVNAILALGCRFSTQPEARSNPEDKHTAGDHYFAEAKRLLEIQGTNHMITTIQALGLMSLREASCGRSSEGLFFAGQSIRLAIELGLHQDVQDDASTLAEIDHEVRSATFWGAFSLDQAWSLSIGRLPHYSKNLRLVNKPSIVDHVEKSIWVPYTDNGAPLERSCTQPSNIRSVYKTFCELAEIIHKSLYVLYTPGQQVTSRMLLSVYTDYLRWYESLTPVLRLGHNFTPVVLFSHMHYHSAILLVFRPFLRLGIVGSGVTPRDICAQAADAISALVNSYSKLYTLRRTPSFVPYFVLTSSIIHLVNLGNALSGPEKILQSMVDLKELTGSHEFATRALQILYFLKRHWRIDGLNEEVSEELEREAEKKCRPRSSSTNLFCPNVAAPDVVSEFEIVKPGENPLFWPFPLQGRPLVVLSQLSDLGFILRSKGEETHSEP